MKENKPQLKMNKSYIASNTNLDELKIEKIDYGSEEVFKGNTKGYFDLEEEETEEETEK